MGCTLAATTGTSFDTTVPMSHRLRNGSLVGGTRYLQDTGRRSACPARPVHCRIQSKQGLHHASLSQLTHPASQVRWESKTHSGAVGTTGQGGEGRLANDGPFLFFYLTYSVIPWGWVGPCLFVGTAFGSFAWRAVIWWSVLVGGIPRCSQRRRDALDPFALYGRSSHHVVTLRSPSMLWRGGPKGRRKASRSGCTTAQVWPPWTWEASPRRKRCWYSGGWQGVPDGSRFTSLRVWGSFGQRCGRHAWWQGEMETEPAALFSRSPPQGGCGEGPSLCRTGAHGGSLSQWTRGERRFYGPHLAGKRDAGRVRPSGRVGERACLARVDTAKLCHLAGKREARVVNCCWGDCPEGRSLGRGCRGLREAASFGLCPLVALQPVGVGPKEPRLL